MERPLRELFSFSRKEQFGILFLTALIVLVIIGHNVYDRILPEPEYAESGLEQKIATLREQEKGRQEDNFISDERYASAKKKKGLPMPFTFDPNTSSAAQFVELGFSEKQAAAILRYREKGGVIRQKEDFAKLYVVNQFMYDRLEQYINIAPPFHAEKKKELPKTQSQELELKEESIDLPTLSLLDLNKASKQDLIDLPGVGPIYASRILKYKDILGGYSSTGQLGEVYGLKDHPEIVEKLRELTTIDSGGVEKIDINSAEWKTLVKHPYIDKNVANSIIAIREEHGPFKSPEELQRSHLVNGELYAKIAPYLTTNVNQ